MNYKEQAIQFAKKHGLKMKINSVEFGSHFLGEKERRYIFNITLTRLRKSYTFKFGQSIAKASKEPTIYDVLSCLQKYDVGSFENFCWDFGYDTDSRIAEKTYKAVCKEYAAVERLFSDIIEELQEIQ